MKYGMSVFVENVQKTQVSFKSDKKNEYFTRRQLDIFFNHISLSSSKNEKCFRQVAEKIKTHILCSTNFISKIVLFMR
jgi:hypothetical protein